MSAEYSAEEVRAQIQYEETQRGRDMLTAALAAQPQSAASPVGVPESRAY